jgi:hypothetical protein
MAANHKGIKRGASIRELSGGIKHKTYKNYCIGAATSYYAIFYAKNIRNNKNIMMGREHPLFPST